MNKLKHLDYKNLIINHLSQKENIIYVLKGFYDISFQTFTLERLIDLDENVFFEMEKIDERRIVDEILSNLKSNHSFVISYDEYCRFIDKLANLLIIFNYKVVIINNNLYHSYYPSPRMITFDKTGLITANKDTVLNGIYNDYIVVDNKIYVEYVGLESAVNNLGLDIDEMGLFDFSSVDYQLLNSFNGKTFFLGSNEDSYLEFLNDVNRSDDTTLYISYDHDEFAEYQKKLLYILSGLGYQIILVKRTLKKVKDGQYKKFENILKRKNKSYQFRNIQFYKNPGFTLETEKISQAEIIDALAKNALLASENKDYNDVFVTAPTGVGKSILFQIPAIYLAENYDLLTIVITPLIGLMNDQIYNIQSMTDCAATINSEYTPEEKDKIKEKIVNKEVSILYVSPETLLSNNPITNLVGDRKIGLFVIDEAHIVSTWGKSFRPDYWFLGDYISYLRTKQGYCFPIATFSATITYGGNDDMHGDIIDSLKMKTGEYEFIAPMRRDDIKFDISIIEKKNDYQKEKDDKVLDSLKHLLANHTKTVAYFPYTKHVENFYKMIAKPDEVVKYHGKLFKEEKDDSAKRFKENKAIMVLATKAFGMGIDIDDIETVYHYAPTGNLCDYVQEIGRAARSNNMQGLAKTDFFENDYRYIKQLFGMSSIKNYQIVETLKKLREIYLAKKKRNFTVSPDEFLYIFPNSYSMQDVETSFKTTMLMIQKDFEKDPTINFKPIIFRPRSLFTRCFFMIHKEDLKIVKRSKFFKYFHLYATAEQMASNYLEEKVVTKINKKSLEINNYEQKTKVKIRYQGDIYSLDMKLMWEENYDDLSFANFKREFYEGELSDFKISKNLIQEYLLTVETCEHNFSEVISILEETFYEIQYQFSKPSIDRTQLTINDIAKIFESIKSISLGKYESMIAAENFVELVNKFHNNSSFGTGYVFKKNVITNKLSISSINLLKTRTNEMVHFLKNRFYNAYNVTKKVFLLRSYDYRKVEDSKELMSCQLLEMFKLASYQVVSGERPEYFVRINSISRIENILNDEFYQSKMVNLVRYRHEQSIKIMNTFFLKLSGDTERWDFIEKYFAGVESVI